MVRVLKRAPQRLILVELYIWFGGQIITLVLREERLAFGMWKRILFGLILQTKNRLDISVL